MRRLLLLSTSTVFGRGFLEYCDAELSGFLADIDRVLFVPFARPSGLSHDDYTAKVRQALARFETEGGSAFFWFVEQAELLGLFVFVYWL